MNTSGDDLRSALEKLGAREFEIVALMMDAGRGQAALDYAVAKGAARPVPYAIKIFDDPNWHPSGAAPNRATNVAVEVSCDKCAGDRFVLVTDDRGPYGETWAPCSACNDSVNTTFWKADGTKAHTPPR